MQRIIVHAEVSKEGYTVFVNHREYTRGNHPRCSTSHELDPRFAIPLEELVTMAEKAVREICAKSPKYANGGVEIVENDA